MIVLLFQSFQWMSRVLQAVDDCVIISEFPWMSRVLQAVDDCVIISEFPVDESCAAGC